MGLEMVNAAYERALTFMRQPVPDCKAALVLLKEAVASGSPEASYALGTWYLFGQCGLRRNAKSARKLIESAAKAGVPNALMDFGVMCEKGDGGPVDSLAAYHCYIEAALRGDKQAVFEVARCLYYGIGCEIDKRLADIWSRRAEELGVYQTDP